MNRIVIAAALFAFAAAASAQESCSVRAADKKLAGAAKTRFMKKCQADAKAACEAQGLSSICGFQDITACACVEGRCEAAPGGGELK